MSTPRCEGVSGHPVKMSALDADTSDMTVRVVESVISPPPNISSLRRLNIVSRLASLGLTAMLVCSTVFGAEAARVTHEAANAASSASALDGYLQTARYAVGAEESLERKYRLEPGPGVLREYHAAATSLEDAMDAVRAMGDGVDRVLANDVVRDHRVYLAATARMFRAVDRHETARVIALDHGSVDPVFGRIERTVRRRAASQAFVAVASLVRLRKTQHNVLGTTFVLAALGLLSLGVFLTVLRAYQRRIKSAHDAEVRALEATAVVDQLTGLGNHRAYREGLARELERARQRGESLALAIVDVDDFKIVNDRNGHLYGDRALGRIAMALRATLRPSDRAYRVGGDEFAICLPCTSRRGAENLLRLVRAEIERELDGLTVTIGFAATADATYSAETLRAWADAAMYSAKRAGRNGLSAFDTSMAGMWLLLPEKLRALRELIESGSIRSVFQPIWDVDGCRVLAFEALSRLDPETGFDGPQEAFDLAERVGRAHELDAVCREAALRAARALPEDALLFLNVTPQSLDRARLDPATLERRVRAAGLVPERVVLELTERSIARVDAVVEAARDLQRRGFRLALDDTGAGNAGLEIMSRLTFDFVKIDRDVIVTAVHDINARGVLAGIIAIAQVTGAYVIAEGIENVEMLEFVCRPQAGAAVRRGVDGVQGYLLRRPSEAFPATSESDDVTALLREFAVGVTNAPTA